MVLILFSLTPSHGRPRPSFALPILTTLPALTETQLLWLMVGASGGAGVVLGAQGISNIAQVCFYHRIKGEFPITGAFKIFALGENTPKALKSICPPGPKLKEFARRLFTFFIQKQLSAISKHKPSFVQSLILEISEYLCCLQIRMTFLFFRQE